jgi:hypothetical protein
VDDEKRAPGLRFDKRGRPFWRATKDAVKAGYPVKNVNLSGMTGDDRAIAGRCTRLQLEMTEWLAGGGAKRKPVFNGTFGSLLDLYETNPKSPFFKLKHASRHPYTVYLRMLHAEIGQCRIDSTDGTDAETWFDFWSAAGKSGKRHVAKARTAIAVLKAAVRFGIMSRLPGCAEFKAVLSACRFEGLQPRQAVIGADQVIAARAAAHALGHPGAALCYAMQFEGTGRQWDMRGQWVPIADPAPSAVISGGLKWIGPTWANIDANLILRFTPSKTQATTGQAVVVDLRACPMALEEIEKVPEAARVGPLIVDPTTGLPYRDAKFAKVWRAVRTRAGIAADVWNRDLRKSGATEARAAGGATDDLQKLMGHAPGSKVTGKVYDQAALEAHRRLAKVRKAHRERKE